MKTQAKCPICNQENWKDIEKYNYSIEDLKEVKPTIFKKISRKIADPLRKVIIASPRKNVVQDRLLNGYQKLRREVLFKVWFPSQTTLNLTSKYCNNCGLATFFPRPTDEDIANKYKYLQQKETNITGVNAPNTKAGNLDNLRAKRIYDASIKFLGNKKLDVLDYGGGTGKLMKPFIEKGHKAYLVDYNNHPIPRVTKISDDLTQYSSDKIFDLIICSHVLEHVSGIGNLIKFLKDQVKKEGIIYAEIPHEVWAGIYLETDPVTHLNFFTENSFKNLFLANGFNILEGKRQMASYGKHHIEVVWVIAQKHQKDSLEMLKPDIKDMLFPSRLYSLKKLFNKVINRL